MAKEATLKYAKKVKKLEKRHFRKYGERKMTFAELDKLCSVKG
jgi:hypothetical protein